MTDEELYLRLIEKYALRVLEDASRGEQAYFAHFSPGFPAFENIYALSRYAQRLPQAIKDAHPKVEWGHIKGIQYALDQPLGFNHEWLWKVVQEDVPQIRDTATTALAGI